MSCDSAHPCQRFNTPPPFEFQLQRLCLHHYFCPELAQDVCGILQAAAEENAAPKAGRKKEKKSKGKKVKEVEPAAAVQGPIPQKPRQKEKPSKGTGEGKKGRKSRKGQ